MTDHVVNVIHWGVAEIARLIVSVMVDGCDVPPVRGFDGGTGVFGKLNDWCEKKVFTSSATHTCTRSLSTCMQHATITKIIISACMPAF